MLSFAWLSALFYLIDLEIHSNKLSVSLGLALVWVLLFSLNCWHLTWPPINSVQINHHTLDIDSSLLVLTWEDWIGTFTDWLHKVPQRQSTFSPSAKISSKIIYLKHLWFHSRIWKNIKINPPMKDNLPIYNLKNKTVLPSNKYQNLLKSCRKLSLRTFILLHYYSSKITTY